MRKQLVESDRIPLYGAFEDEYTLFSRENVIDSGSKMTSEHDSNTNGLQNGKDSEKKLKYPKSVFFIISNEFCERFSYYGMRTVLALYLRNALGYDEQSATMIYHVFIMLCYFTPLFGGIMADAWLGKFKTILYVSIVYALGNIVLAIGSVGAINIPHKVLSLLGLFLIALGTGGIKPCVSSFGGDQFVIPQQEKQLQSFFSVFYFSINAGSLISSFLTPVLREESCLGSNDCYPLAFGLPAVLMVVAIVFFVCGSPMYKRIKPQGNIALEAGGCVSHSILRKMNSKEKKDHWLDYGDNKYSTSLIADTKVLMKLVYLFSPTIVFWALFEQQGSKWTFQATRMNGDLGWYVIQPDQMQTLNAVLVLIFIPLFESVVYPILAKLRLVRTPLQKLCVGGFLAALAFVVSGLLQIKIQADAPPLPGSGESQLVLYNSFNCEARFTGIDAQLPAFSYMSLPNLKPGDQNLKITGSCFKEWNGQITLYNEKVSSYFLRAANPEGETDLFPLKLQGNEEAEKSDTGEPKVKVIYSGVNDINITLSDGSKVFTFSVTNSSHQTTQQTIAGSGKFSIQSGGKNIGDMVIDQGGVYTIMISEELKCHVMTVINPNSVNILWQIPQYIIITSAEIMFSITGLEFSYSQSPVSMKSIISSLWLLTDALGNIIIIIIEGIKIQNTVLEMFIYAGVMALAMIVFTILAMRYKYETSQEKEETQKDLELEQTKI